MQIETFAFKPGLRLFGVTQMVDRKARHLAFQLLTQFKAGELTYDLVLELWPVSTHDQGMIKILNHFKNLSLLKDQKHKTSLEQITSTTDDCMFLLDPFSDDLDGGFSLKKNKLIAFDRKKKLKPSIEIKDFWT